MQSAGGGVVADMQDIYGPGSNIVECAVGVLRFIGRNMPPAGE